ncbi:MAG: AAA family ATPase, partial [Patescibacteria group bacterium]
KAFMEFEAARSSLVKLQEEKNKVNFEKERIDIRVKDLGEQIREAGRDIKEFETWAGEEVKSEEETSRKMFRLRGELAAIGDIDQNIVKEYKETETRNIFLTTQVADLEKAIADLHNLIQDLDYKIQHEFITAIGKINGELSRYMDLLFGGGKAKLIVEEKKTKSSVEEIENVQTTNPKTEGEESVAAPVPEGVYIDVSLPRKRIKGLEVLSGGERALVSVAALFALISVSPPPFLVLDEVDAPLDEKNARRFGELLKEFAKKTQFIIVTHNRATMEVANVLYGVTMSADGTSKVLSVKLS